ncbi:MAG: UDP-3-O-(3-hydroxymyristoyl)glucosamine N-acyltransferase, partial [Akkermansia sp.]|nr:UDP-3-O-(3-hydroxymyristoyl)glucosamine N-acyltransferase [Akkermansia sp.]
MNLSIDDVLKLTGGKLLNTAPEVQISGVASLDEACPGDVSFLGNEKYFKDFLATKASVVLVPPALPQHPKGVCLVEVENPSLAFNALVDHFMKAANDFTPGVEEGAVVHPTARFNADKVRIGPNAVVEADAEIGDGCDIGPGCVIGKSAKLGEHCKLHARVVVRERCIL